MPSTTSRAADVATGDSRAVVTSYGKLAIGAPRRAVLAALGPAVSTTTEKEERETYEEAGYEPDDELVFVAGFDKRDRFNVPKDPAVPAFKVFYRADRVVAFTLSIYVYHDEADRPDPLDESSVVAKADRTKVGFPPRCYLFGDRADAVATFGAPELAEPTDPNGNQSLHYLKRGLSVVLDGDTIVAIDVYGQLAAGVETTFRARVANARAGDADE